MLTAGREPAQVRHDPRYSSSGAFGLGRPFGLLDTTGGVSAPVALPFGLRNAVIAPVVEVGDLSAYGFDHDQRIGGVLSALPRWLNHPAAIASAEYKPVHLAHARSCGLPVPATIVTNDPGEAATFVAEAGRAICKPFTANGVIEDDTHRVAYTTVVAVGDIDESIRLTAHLLQAWVPKQYEVRLTAVDEVFFATRIDADGDAAALDWRADYPALTYTPIDVPGPVRVRVSALMRRLELRFGAIDFVVTPDNRWIFLEINSNGQWAWIEDATGQPVTAALADALTRENS